jgi:3-dehydroquinate dehydratase-2
MKLQIINGPNLNLLGTRETDVYGNITFDEYFKILENKYSNVYLDVFQSNVEGEIINKIQEVGFEFDGIILNAAAYTHTSVGIADAVRSINSPVIEVHISNTISREDYRHNSYIGPHAKGIIMGFGLKSYNLAIESFISNS